MNKGRAEGESQQQNERDCGQSPVGDRGALTVLGAGLGAAATFNSLNFGQPALTLLGTGLGAVSPFDSFHFGRRVLTLLGAGWGAVSTFDSFHLGRRTLTLLGGDLGAVPAGVQKAMFEGPVLSQIVPAVVLQFPAVMAEPTHQRGGKGMGIQSRNPEPFVLGRFGLQLAPTVMVLRELLFGPHDPYRLRVIGGER